MIFEKEDLQASRQIFLNNLRSQTLHLHTQLEQLPASIKLTSSNLLIEDYIHYLQLMQPVIYHTEQYIFPLIKDVIDDVDERKKYQLLQNDLNYLQAKNSSAQFIFNTDKETDVAFALGIMYVIEGSTLGGRIILKNVQQVLGLNENNGASYFAGYQQKTSSLWKRFLDMLSSYQTTNKKEQKIIAGANAAFTSIFNFMQ